MVIVGPTYRNAIKEIIGLSWIANAQLNALFPSFFSEVTFSTFTTSKKKKKKGKHLFKNLPQIPLPMKYKEKQL